MLNERPPINDFSVLVLQDNIGSINPSQGLDDLFALVGLPSRRRSNGELSEPAGEILKGISSFIDDLLLKVIASQTEGEFIAARKSSFARYAGAVSSLAKIVQIVVPSSVIERAVNESFCELEAEFREQGTARFGTPARDQAMFTVWTLRRTSGLMSKIAGAGPVPENLKAKDAELASKFSFNGIWAQFHLDCLLAAIRFEKTIQIETMSVIIDGLRAAVNAYGYGREGLHLRTVEPQPLLNSYEWDDEDQQLLSSSMREMKAEAMEWHPHVSSCVSLALSQDDALPGVKYSTLDRRETPPIFGAHIREGIEIIQDWINSRKQ